jgi:hypothetical protein
MIVVKNARIKSTVFGIFKKYTIRNKIHAIEKEITSEYASFKEYCS